MRNALKIAKSLVTSRYVLLLTVMVLTLIKSVLKGILLAMIYNSLALIFSIQLSLLLSYQFCMFYF